MPVKKMAKIFIHHSVLQRKLMNHLEQKHEIWYGDSKYTSSIWNNLSKSTITNIATVQNIGPSSMFVIKNTVLWDVTACRLIEIH
jgi:hypothetical protein